MTTSVALIVAVGALFATGVVLLLERSLTRIVVGVVLLGNGVNLLVIATTGRAGGAPIVGETAPAEMTDALPQAMVLTAIVISLGLVAFLLALAHRSWQLHGHDEVQDDVEDRRIALLSETPDVDVSDDVDVGADADAEAEADSAAGANAVGTDPVTGAPVGADMATVARQGVAGDDAGTGAETEVGRR